MEVLQRAIHTDRPFPHYIEGELEELPLSEYVGCRSAAYVRAHLFTLSFRSLCSLYHLPICLIWAIAQLSLVGLAVMGVSLVTAISLPVSFLFNSSGPKSLNSFHRSVTCGMYKNVFNSRLVENMKYNFLLPKRWICLMEFEQTYLELTPPSQGNCAEIIVDRFQLNYLYGI